MYTPDEVQALRDERADDVFDDSDRTIQIANWDLSEYRSVQMVEAGTVNSIIETPAFARAKKSIDTLWLGKRPAWHGLGTVDVEDVVTGAEAIVKGKLDWTVEQHPIYANIEREVLYEFAPEQFATRKESVNAPVATHVANIRSDTNTVLGIVGTRYQPLQNTEAFDVLDEIVASSDAKYHVVGSLYEGRKVFLCAKLDKDIRIGDSDDEVLDPFIVLHNSHDGTGALRVIITPIRPVCQNTVRLALSTASLQWAARHTPNIKARADQARAALKISFRYYDELKIVGDQMINEKITDREFWKIVEHLMPTPHGKDVTDRQRDNVDVARYSLMGLYQNADNLANIRGTKWGALNAVVEYADYLTPMRATSIGTKAERRFEKVVLDGDQALQDRAYTLLMA